MKRTVSLFLAIVLLASLACACQGPASDPGVQPTDGVPSGTGAGEAQPTPPEQAEPLEYVDLYKTYFTSEYPSLNYYTTVYGGVRGLAANCVEALVEPDEYGLYQPAMALSWESNEDCTVWTFHLREGVEWVDHQGNPTGMKVTAQDYVDAVRYVGDPLNGAYSLRVVRDLIEGLYDYYWGLDDIDSGTDTTTVRADLVASFDETVGVKALDEYTVQYTLSASAPYFLSLIEGSMLLLPCEYSYVTEMGEDFGIDNQHMLYCGAYYLSTFERDKKIVMTANPHYWDKDSVTIRSIEQQRLGDTMTTLEMFKRGEIDECVVESEEYSSLLGTEWEKYLAPNSFSSSTNYLWLDFGSDNPEFNAFIHNENFRKALQHSIDRESIAYLREPVTPSRLVRNTIIAETLIYDDRGVDYTDYPGLAEIKATDYYDAGKARAYMEAAVAELCDASGSILGVDAATVDMLPVAQFDVDGKLPVTLLYVGTDDEAEILMAQLLEVMIEEAIGADLIDVQLAFATGGFYSTVADPLNYDVYYDSLSVPYGDPGSQLSRLTSDGAENVGYYEVPEYDALIEQALMESDIQKRYALFAQAEAYLVNGAYVIPFISSLRGYYMTRIEPYTGPLMQFGSIKYKGMRVSAQILTADQLAAISSAYEEKKADRLSGN
ncbi:MAG: Oligopeptide-binding protein SarA precursor [Firmicutes bacterium ADurb.Bin248]|nr:MAG: Oligopeptide-binding protein SarA precursor [Firmicutes bacterium ADurb.Bin248]HOF99666.1 ABC transporter substrate-binding protein [Clostridia bacterium]HPK15902.1 ABC transporter substrate-binding protein [Clostridia bacterium]